MDRIDRRCDRSLRFTKRRIVRKECKRMKTTEPVAQSDLQHAVIAEKSPAPQLPLSDLFQQLDTSAQGLTTQEAQRRFQKDGPNDPAAKSRETGFTQLLRLFLNPLVIILLIASGVSAI